MQQKDNKHTQTKRGAENQCVFVLLQQMIMKYHEALIGLPCAPQRLCPVTASAGLSCIMRLRAHKEVRNDNGAKCIAVS